MVVPVRVAGSPAPGIQVQVQEKLSPLEKMVVLAMAF
jgi:hypothetical protein